MRNSRQLLTIFLLALGLFVLAAPVEEKVLFTIQDKAADFTLPGIANQVVEAPARHARGEVRAGGGSRVGALTRPRPAGTVGGPAARRRRWCAPEGQP